MRKKLHMFFYNSRERPLFFFWWIISLPIFYVFFSKKMKKIYWLEVWIFCKMHYRIPLFLALRLSVRRFQMPLMSWRFKLWKLWQHLKSSIQQTHFYKVWLRSFASIDSPFDIFNHKPPLTTLNYVRQLFKIRVVFHSLYLRNKVGNPNVFLHFWH